jgi:hypothetical protein
MSSPDPDVVGAKSKPSRELGEPIRGGDPIAAASERGVEMSLDAADKSVYATIWAQAFSDGTQPTRNLSDLLQPI